MPEKEPKYAKRFLNVNKAMQMGFEILFKGELNRFFSYRGGLAYTYGENLDWNEPLAEIPPLELKLSMRYTHSSQRFWTEISGRFVNDQKRIAKSFGETTTPAFSVINLLASYSPLRFIDLNFGIQNLFNKNFYEHLNRKYVNQPINEIVYEPGRNFTFQVKFYY